VFENKNDEFWFGSEHGVYTLDHDSITPFHHELKPFGGWIDDINKTKDGRILITTRDSGLAIVDHKKIDFITTKDGLQSNSCISLFSDTLSGKIYLGMNKGLSVISFDGNNKPEITNYNPTNGLLCGAIYSVSESDGEILLSTDKGLLVFNEKDLNTTVESPKVYITNLLINSKNVALKPDYNLSHTDNNIRITYNGISFRDAKSLEYRYQLTPIDTGWNSTFANTVVYPDLSPGFYKFTVQVRTGNGKWFYDNSSFNFKINKPYWVTWWFILIVCSIGVIVIGGMFRFKISQTYKEHEIANTLLQTELKALRAQINPHFIFNSINSIQDFIFSNEPEEANEYLTKFAILMRKILQNSEKKVISLHDEIEFLEVYLQLESLRLSDKFEYEIFVDEGLDTDDLFLPPMLLQLYIENAILHGLAPLDHKGKLNISFTLKNNCLLCIIKDNGIGRKKSEEQKMNKQINHHKSFGMRTTNDRIEAINKSDDSKIEISIIDLIYEGQNTFGTEIILKFPQ
jgi:hypothetical protein